MNVIADKVIKNHFTSKYIYHKHKDEKSCELIAQDIDLGIMWEVIPCTNPTFTMFSKH